MDRHSAKTGCVEHTEFSIVSSMAGSGSGLGGNLCGAGAAHPWLSMQVLGAPTASTPTEGGFAQELIGPSEGGCWTHCQGLMARGGGGGRSGRTPRDPTHPPTGRLADQVTQGQTTNVSTAAMLVYATGAGITAAAGTRLALQLVLIAMFG